MATRDRHRLSWLFNSQLGTGDGSEMFRRASLGGVSRLARQICSAVNLMMMMMMISIFKIMARGGDADDSRLFAFNSRDRV